MHWTKSKITRWTAVGGFRITEDVELGERPYRLDSPVGDGEFFGTLKEAQANAALKNELMLARDELDRLREQLDVRAGRWPDANTTVAPPVDEDGRGIPASTTRLTCVAAPADEYPF